MRNRDCSQRGRGGGSDSSRGTDRGTTRDTDKARLRPRGRVWVRVMGNRDSVRRSRRRGLSRYSSSGACEGRGGFIVGET